MTNFTQEHTFKTLLTNQNKKINTKQTILSNLDNIFKNYLKRFFRFTLPLIFILGGSMDGWAQCDCTDCRCNDSLELVNFYKATDGANWINKWDFSQPMTSWNGVTLTDGRVRLLSRSANRLKGILPDLNLSHLQGLALDNNQLSGMSDLNLPKLEYLWLNSNQFKTISTLNLPNLQLLQLNNNALNGNIPSFDLPKLQELYLNNNQLIGTIPNFNLPNLQVLILYNNQLSGAIPNFNLPKLQQLYLHINKLSGSLPNFNLPNLSALNLSNNQLTGSIPNFNLPNLQSLNVQKNQLSGTIPNFNLPTLNLFYADNNQLTGKIPNFNLPNLQELYLNSNKLNGTIPDFYLPKLLYIYLNDNQLSGCIPQSIKIQCPLINASGGNVANNPNLATQSWSNYWINREGSCATTATGSATINPWRIYPNPAHEVLYVEGMSDRSKILIYNVIGGLVLNTNLKENAVDISHLSSGLYTFVFETNGKCLVEKFTKQ